MKIDRNRFYPVSEVAHILHCHRSTVWRLSRRGKLPAIVRVSEKLSGMPGDELDDAVSALRQQAQQERAVA